MSGVRDDAGPEPESTLHGRYVRGSSLIQADLASAGPGFSIEDLLGLLAFVIDLTLGPICGIIVVVALVLRNGWRGWRPILTVLGVLNVMIAGVLAAFAGSDGLGTLVALVWLQLALALAVVVSVNVQRSREALFGVDSHRRILRATEDSNL